MSTIVHHRHDGIAEWLTRVDDLLRDSALDRNLIRRPRVGDVLNTRVGAAVVTAVHDRGRRVEVRTRVHGTETITRADTGWWTRIPHQEAPR